MDLLRKGKLLDAGEWTLPVLWTPSITLASPFPAGPRLRDPEPPAQSTPTTEVPEEWPWSFEGRLDLGARGVKNDSGGPR